MKMKYLMVAASILAISSFEVRGSAAQVLQQPAQQMGPGMAQQPVSLPVQGQQGFAAPVAGQGFSAQMPAQRMLTIDEAISLIDRYKATTGKDDFDNERGLLLNVKNILVDLVKDINEEMAEQQALNRASKNQGKQIQAKQSYNALVGQLQRIIGEINKLTDDVGANGGLPQPGVPATPGAPTNLTGGELYNQTRAGFNPVPQSTATAAPAAQPNQFQQARAGLKSVPQGQQATRFRTDTARTTSQLKVPATPGR